MNQSRIRLGALVVLAMVASCQGCLGCKTSPLDAPDTTLPRTCNAEQPLISPSKLDILFVIDNSNSMQEEQDAVSRELTAFIDEIKHAGGVRQDFNVGVVTTSVYQHTLQNGVSWMRDFPTQSGHLRAVPTVLADGGLNLEAGTERVLSGEDPELVGKFAKLVRQGTFGSGQETPFEAVRLALLTDLNRVPVANGGNYGFLRDGARLLIVVLTDEDDCSETARPSSVVISDNPSVSDCNVHANSLGTVDSYYQLFTTGLKNDDGSPKEIIWTAIAPVARNTKGAMEVLDGVQVRNIDCPTSNAAGFRHRQMAEHFDPSLINLDSICRDSFRETLVTIAGLASVSQTVEITNVPAPEMVQVQISRKDSSVQACTEGNNGIKVIAPSAAGVSTKVRFQNQCLRRADDTALAVKLLCAT